MCVCVCLAGFWSASAAPISTEFFVGFSGGAHAQQGADSARWRSGWWSGAHLADQTCLDTQALEKEADGERMRKRKVECVLGTISLHSNASKAKSFPGL